MRLFAEHIDGDRPAVRCGPETLTYAALKQQVGAAADQLRRAGVEPSSRVAIAAGGARDGQSIDNWIAHLAVMAIGATHASVTWGKGLANLWRAGAINMLVAPPMTGELLPQGLRHVALDRSALSRERLHALPDKARPGRINTTSGTTGKPKIVVWSPSILEARLGQVASQLTCESQVAVLLKITTTAGFRYPLATLRAGGTVVFRHKDEEPSLFETIDRSTLLICSPEQLAQALRNRPGQWPGRDQRRVVVLGARMPTDVRDQAIERAAREIHIGYGSTEGGNIASGDCLHADRHPGAVGFVREGVTVQIINGRGEQQPPGQRGLIRVRGEAVADGAYTRGADGEPWFYPGDLGVLFENGLLAIEGRASETVNVAGNKYSAAELESRIADVPGVRELCLCVVPLAGRDQATVALVCEPGANLRDIKLTIGTRLPFEDFGVVSLPRLPRNAMGKVPRASLAKAIAATIEQESRELRHA